ncbi:NAD-dependent epimerase/dehydratase family protein [candidate division KSB1 bacterium]|nr:NAD-dependent epimerase/dehydratase family protein [candidate division KSB1 bacterium]
MKVLFIGGTGKISSACTVAALQRGVDLYLLNRGKSWRTVPEGVKEIHADISDKKSVVNALNDQTFDVVVNWIVFTPEEIERDIDLFKGRTGQYIFISSASAYHKPVISLPITESTPLHNPFWSYSQKKIACEKRLYRACFEENFPITIVRPSHTYDETMLIVSGNYTTVNRMRKGKKVIIHGDGTSLWTVTHNSDFAKGFTGLLGNHYAIGEAVHITSDQVLTWNQIYELVAARAGAELQAVHLPSELIAAYDSEWGAGLLGDKSHSAVFDNTKIKRLVPDFNASIPFSRGIETIMNWYDADSSRQQVDTKLDALMDRLVERYSSLFPPL